MVMTFTITLNDLSIFSIINVAEHSGATLVSYNYNCNSNYNSQEEIGQRVCEEARILYVALTRAIRNCIWMKDVDKKANMSWSKFLEV